MFFNFACTRQPPVWVYQTRSKQTLISSCTSFAGHVDIYLVVGVILIVLIVTQIILILVFLVIKLVTLEVTLVELFKAKSLAGEPVDSTRNELLLDVLTKLVVKLKALLNLRANLGLLVIFLIIITGGLRWREEVEERLCGNCLLDNAGLLRVCKEQNC